MKKKHHLSLEDTFEESFHLFTIYCEEESYRMAFILNRMLDLQLQKTKSIVRKKDLGEFAVYEYLDHSKYQHWYLVSNHSLLKSEMPATDLFSSSNTIFEQKIHYVKELKKAPYLLKFDAEVDASFLRNLLKKLQSIPQIYTAELINLAQLKNQKLLIF